MTNRRMFLFQALSALPMVALGSRIAHAAACEEGRTASEIGSNHGHELSMPAADVLAAADKSYDITGTSSHPHTVTVTAADFKKLAAQGSLVLASSMDFGHAHSVRVICA